MAQVRTSALECSHFPYPISSHFPYPISRSGGHCDGDAESAISTSTSVSSSSPTSLRVLVPDEASAAIVAKCVPAHPAMTARDACKMVAHKMGITNPEDFALFSLSGGSGE